MLNDMCRLLPFLPCLQSGTDSNSDLGIFSIFFSIYGHQSGEPVNWPGTPIVPIALSLLVMVMLSDPGESEMLRLLKMPLISLRSSET